MIEGDSNIEFARSLRLLNLLQGDFTPWRDAVAAEKECDVFGEIIQPGEIFFRRDHGDQLEMLSYESMQRLLKILFKNSYYIDQLISKIDAPQTSNNKLNLWV